MATQNAKRDNNRVTTLLGVDSVGYTDPTTVAVDPSTHALIVSGGGGGTQYQEGATKSPATGTVAMGRYNLAAPTLTDGQLYGLQLDSSGSLKVAASFSPSGTQDVNLVKVGGTSIALGQTTMSASIPVTFASNQSALPVTLTSTTITGTVAVTQSTSPWIVAGGGTAGSAATGVVTVQGIASMTPVQVSQATASSLNATVVGAGSAGSANAGVVTVQGIASMTPVQVSQATASNLNATVVQGTATNLKAQAENYQGGTAVSSSNPLEVNIRSATAGINVSTNLAQLAGNTISSGVGTTGTGTLRMVQANGTGRTLSSAGGSASSSGNNTLVAAGTNRLKVYAFTLSTTSTSSTTCIFQSGAGGTELWRVVLQAASSTNTGATLSVTPPAFIFATASATLLNLNLSGANTIHWSVAYFDEA